MQHIGNSNFSLEYIITNDMSESDENEIYANWFVIFRNPLRVQQLVYFIQLY